MQGLQATLVAIIAAAAFIAGIIGERARAELGMSSLAEEALGES